MWNEVVTLVGGLVGAVVAVVLTRESLHLALARLAPDPRGIILRVGGRQHCHDQDAA